MTEGYFPKGGGPLNAELDLVVEAFMATVQRQDGTLIRHSEIAEVAKVAAGSPQYYRLAKRWKHRMLREHSIVISHRVGAGYVALPDGEKTDAALDRLRSGARSIRRGGEIIRATDREKLSAPQQKTHDMVAVQAADLLRRTRMLTRTASVELHGTPALPAVDKA